MASLIPAQVIAEMIDQQNPQPTQASPQALASIFHPAMQLQLAQQLRRQSAVPPQARAPLADHVRQARMAGTQGTMPHDFNGQQPAQGTMSIQSGHPIPNRDQTQAAPVQTNDAGKLALLHQMLANGPGSQIDLNQGGTSGHGGLMPMGNNAVQAGARANRQHLSPGESIQPIAGGYQINGAGPQQQADPVVQTLSAFKGHVPDHLLAAAQNAIQAGMPLQQVFGHLQTAAQQAARPQPAARDNTAAQTRTMEEAQIRHLEAQEKIAAEHGEDTSGFDKQIEAHIAKLGPQQQAQVPQPPKPGHALDPQSAQQFLHAAGGDKNKARELARQAGWSF